ncbi:MAG: asparaginase [Lysobacter sp.]|nr:asparaginase [Lysobacter sp.]
MSAEYRTRTDGKSARVVVLTLGGTIASAPGEDNALASPRLNGFDLVRALPGLPEDVDLQVEDMHRLPSTDLTLAVAASVAERARAVVADGADGVVVTQGTDTIEEMAYCLDLLYDAAEPLVVTGAMRHAGQAGADGPANLLAAVQVAASPVCRDAGCLVVANDEIHAARLVRKAHTSSPAAFRSPSGGPLGWLTEGKPRFLGSRWPRLAFPPSDAIGAPPIPLVKIVMDDNGWWLDALSTRPPAGLVIEGMGGGHIPGPLALRVGALAADIPVVLASRTGAGDVLTSTYGGFPGAETALLDAGLIPAGVLDGLKSRLLLSLLLAGGASREPIAAVFNRMGTPGD